MYQKVFLLFSAVFLYFSGILCFSYCPFRKEYNELTFNTISLALSPAVKIICFFQDFQVLMKLSNGSYGHKKVKKKSVYIVYRVFVLLGKNEIMQFSLVELQSG